MKSPLCPWYPTNTHYETRTGIQPDSGSSSSAKKHTVRWIPHLRGNEHATPMSNPMAYGRFTNINHIARKQNDGIQTIFETRYFETNFSPKKKKLRPLSFIIAPVQCETLRMVKASYLFRSTVCHDACYGRGGSHFFSPTFSDS